MLHTLLPLLALLQAAAPSPMEPAKDLFMHGLRVPGVEVRFVDYHWQPALFEAMEKGSRDIPEAQRDWVIARVVLDNRALTLGDARVGVGNYGLTLWPSQGGQGMMAELRKVDMRDVFPNLNVIAPCPRGVTVYKAPAAFASGKEMAERMVLTLKEDAGKVLLTVRYGDRELVLTFTR